MFHIGNNNSDVTNVTLHIFCYILIGGWGFLATFHLLGLFYGYVFCFVILIQLFRL